MGEQETYITDTNVAKYASDICSGEQISLGKCVQGHTFPGGTHVTVTLYFSHSE